MATVLETKKGGPNMLGENPSELDLATLDVSRAELFENNIHGEYFRRLRDEEPVHYCPDSMHGPYWSITRFQDIVKIDSNHKVFSSERDIVIGDAPEDFSPPMFIAMDRPKHDVQRKAANPAVAPTQLADLEPLIRGRIATILDELPIGEEFNWVDLVSRNITIQMLATLFDFPWEDRALLSTWSDAATNSQAAGVADADMDERERILKECLEYFARLWAERAQGEPKFDFISLLAHNPDTKDMLERDPTEFLGNLILLIVGGNDTTRNSMSASILAMNKFPDQFQKLKADQSLIPNMVSEVIRWQTPLGHMRRTALEDIEFQGKQIKKGDKVIMWYVSGNRDERVIDDPDAFLIDRERARHHLSFGFGIHRCMGNRVGEMQVRILWEEILKRFDRVELVGEPSRIHSNFVMGYDKMPVVVHAK